MQASGEAKGGAKAAPPKPRTRVQPDGTVWRTAMVMSKSAVPKGGEGALRITVWVSRGKAMVSGVSE